MNGADIHRRMVVLVVGIATMIASTAAMADWTTGVGGRADRNGFAPEVGAIHAGLECGIIGEKVPGMDMISFGPTIQFPHSPDERVHVESVGRFWNLLTTTLESLAKRG